MLSFVWRVLQPVCGVLLERSWRREGGGGGERVVVSVLSVVISLVVLHIVYVYGLSFVIVVIKRIRK